MRENVISMTDSYKVSHHLQYPPGTNKVYSYFEARAGGEYPEAVFFGLQYLLMRYFAGQVISSQKIDQAAQLFAAHFGNDKLFNRDGWEYILRRHNGRLPLRIKAVPEGMIVPESNVLMTVENTDPQCAWLVNYVETILVQTWYPITTATISREMKKVLKRALEISGDDSEANLAFKLHDFGYRGVSSIESAAIGGAAHLVNFQGTDTIAGLELLIDYYGAKMPGFSIPAAEHSTMTSYGKEGEAEAYGNMLTQFPKGLVAVVSDSWDVRRAVSEIWGKQLRDRVLSRDGVLVIRPDSGDPCEVLPELLELAGQAFGYERNSKGYKVLNSKVRLIQGDGISRHTLGHIVDTVVKSKWSADNLAFGSGGGLLQMCNRDTLRMAFKASYIEVNGEGRDVYKQPATDSTKNSKRGRLMLVERAGELVTIPETPDETDILQEVFVDGEVVKTYCLDEIREQAKVGVMLPGRVVQIGKKVAV